MYFHRPFLTLAWSMALRTDGETYRQRLNQPPLVLGAGSSPWSSSRPDFSIRIGASRRSPPGGLPVGICAGVRSRFGRRGRFDFLKLRCGPGRRPGSRGRRGRGLGLRSRRRGRTGPRDRTDVFASPQEELPLLFISQLSTKRRQIGGE
jgi:hypothetical protein